MSEIEVVTASSPPVGVEYAPLPPLGEIAPGIRRVAVTRGDAVPPAVAAQMAMATRGERKFYAYDKSRVVMSGWPHPLPGDEPREIAPEEASILVDKWNAEKLAERQKDIEASSAEREEARGKLEEAQAFRGALLLKIAEAAGIDPIEIATGMGIDPKVASQLVQLGKATQPAPKPIVHPSVADLQPPDHNLLTFSKDTGK